jgi:hypothetical protein
VYNIPSFSTGDPISISDLEGADVSDNLSQEENRYAMVQEEEDD